MSDYDNENSGVLFKNDRKESDRHPDYTGTYTDGDGNEFWLSAWIKTGQSGKKFMSLSTRRKDENQGQKPANSKPADNFDFEQDIPF